MMSPASRSPESRVLRAALLAVVFVAGTAWARAQAVPVSSSANGAEEPPNFVVPSTNPFEGRFTDVVLKTHDGKTVRFYQDLLKGKVVLINFMYANCKGR